MTFQAHIKDSVVTSDVSGRQVTPIPDTHRLELPPFPLTPSRANTGFTPLALFRPQHFSLSEGPFPSSLSLSFPRLKNRIFPHHLHTKQLLKLPLIAMPSLPPLPAGFMVPRRALRTVCKPALLLRHLKNPRPKKSLSGREAL